MDEEEEPVAEEPQRESRTRPKTARAANPQPMSSSASPEELDTIMDPS